MSIPRAANPGAPLRRAENRRRPRSAGGGGAAFQSAGQTLRGAQGKLPLDEPGFKAARARSGSMQYTKLGRTGLEVSRLCLGTMNFGPHASPKESFAIMDRALEHGINFFDTADVYGWKKGEGV